MTALTIHIAIPLKLVLPIQCHRSTCIFYRTMMVTVLLNVNTQVNLGKVTKATRTNSTVSVLLLVWVVNRRVPNREPRMMDSKNGKIILKCMSHKDFVSNDIDHLVATYTEWQCVCRSQVIWTYSCDMVPVVCDAFLYFHKSIEQTLSEIVDNRYPCQNGSLPTWTNTNHCMPLSPQVLK